MTSKDDDDTLPLPGTFSQDFSVDITADEDFIPTSQPKSSRSSKITKKPELITQDSDKREKNIYVVAATQLSHSARDSTVLLDCLADQSLDKDKSSDFIPETETKKPKEEFLKKQIRKRKLSIEDTFDKLTEDIFDTHSNSQWNMEISEIPESPNIETQTSLILNDLSGAIDSPNRSTKRDVILCSIAENEKKCEESITEILVNDSAETVELDASGNSCQSKVKKTDVEMKMSADTLKLSSSSFDSNLGRCEETQIFDKSLVLLLDQQEPVNVENSEKTQNSLTSEKLYLAETLSNNEVSQLEGKKSATLSGLTLPILHNMSKELSLEEGIIQTINAETNGNVSIKEENNLYSTPKKSPETSSSLLQTKKMEFKLLVSSTVTMNVKTKQVLQKLIVNVKEFITPKPKSTIHMDHNLDSTSDKSKRCSTSSSGSVYSDKTGLPFALPKRVSAISDQTDASDSSEEGFTKLFLEGRNAFQRTPWSNEYLLPLKLDELMKLSLENSELNRPSNAPSPSKFKNQNSKASNHLEEILEYSSSEHTSVNHLDCISNTSETNNIKNFEERNVNSESPNTEKLLDKVTKEYILKKSDDQEKAQNGSVMEPPNFSNSSQSQSTDNLSTGEIPEVLEKDVVEESQSIIKKAIEVEDDDCIQLRHGLPVFARWTDKRYYSGVITSNEPKNDRWDVKFDDGTIKAIREDFLFPTKWLKTGELVFALDNDRYLSGQIFDVKLGEKECYVVELDNEKKKVAVKISDLYLTDVLAGIVKEKHKTLVATPRGKGSEIDFDNVLTGKRLREQKTPRKDSVNSDSKKVHKNTKDEAGKKSEPSIKETPHKKTSSKKESLRKVAGLQSENGHLIEDKVISADSPSGNDETGPPSNGSRGKVKPRSLSYEIEDRKGKIKAKTSDWLSPDGTPIPGPSGVKFRKRNKLGNVKSETVNKLALASVEEETTPLRSSRNSDKKIVSEGGQSNLKDSKLERKTPVAAQSSSTEKCRGKRKLVLDEPIESEVRAKLSKKSDNRKKKPRNRKG